ncbi:MAG: hypothetical protein OXJ52_10185 [Oligoflexia bacterium]|nr:hypothetical protein [Oligoflexia bacterium]
MTVFTTIVAEMTRNREKSKTRLPPSFPRGQAPRFREDKLSGSDGREENSILAIFFFSQN